MPISVTPVLPVNATQGAAPQLVLQPGTVVDATVLKILAADLVRIAINSLSIDVLSEVPLQAGQTLQLAVSQTPDGGVRLAVVGQGAGTAEGPPAANVSLTPGVLVDAAANPAVISASAVTSAPPVNALTPVERVAVAAATQVAATQQGSLAPLFANLGVAAGSSTLPPALQQAIAQVLAQQTPLDQNLTGSDVKTAFETSGLFLEASLATGSVPTASGSVSTASGIPDLKAALIVLRQTLLSSLGTTGAIESAATSATATSQPVSATVAPQPGSATATATATASTPSPSLSPETELVEILLPQARVPVAVDAVELDSSGRVLFSAIPPETESRATTIGAALNLLQEALQEMPRQNDSASQAAAMPKDTVNEDVTFHTTTPPPPFRGALPSAQAVASPSIAPNTPLAISSHQLLGDTDAAIARQTLLQVASLPEQTSTVSTQIDPATPRWSFEIPFATPQGTAVTQFEISRDGGGSEVEAAKRVWRARFSLDIEPAGPVHALVSLNGDKTSVRMWAERPATAAQLRQGAAQLSQALSRAELQPGDIVIRDGMPPPSTPAPAGHFLDRAL